MDNSEKGTIYVEGAGQQIANPISSENGVDLKKIYTTVPEDKGRILDVGNAQELAKTENILGQSARVAQEKSMEFAAKEGMTEIQKRNVELMAGIEQKYPDAFFSTIDEKGRKILVASTGEYGTIWGGRSVVFSKDAVIMLDNSNIGRSDGAIKNIDWNKFNDSIENSLQENSRVWIKNYRNETEAKLWMGEIGSEQYKKENGRSGGYISIDALQMDVDKKIPEIKQILEISQGLGAEKKMRESAPPPKSASELLSAL